MILKLTRSDSVTNSQPAKFYPNAESVVWEVARHEEVSMAGVTRAVPGEGGH